MDQKIVFDELRINENEDPIEIKKDWLLQYRGSCSLDEMQQKQLEGKLYTTPLLKAMLLSYYKRNCWNNSDSKDKYLIIKDGGTTPEFEDLKSSLMLNEQNYGRIKAVRKFCIKKYGLMNKLSRRWFIFKGTNLAIYHSALENTKPKLYSLVGATYEIEEFSTHNHKTPWHSPIEYINENGAVGFTEAKYRLSVVTREPKLRYFSLYSNLKDEISDWVKIFHVANLNLDQNQAALISNVITRIVQRDLPIAWDALSHEAENRAHRETMLKCFVNRLRYLNATRVITKWMRIYESQNKDRDIGLKLLGREVMIGRLYNKYKKHTRTEDQKEEIIELIQEGFRYEKNTRKIKVKLMTEENSKELNDDSVSLEAAYAGTQIRQGKEGRNFQVVYYVNPDLKQLNTNKNKDKMTNQKYSLISNGIENSTVKISKDLSKILWQPNKWTQFDKYLHIDVDTISCIILNAEKPYYVRKYLEKLPKLKEQFKVAECPDRLIDTVDDSWIIPTTESQLTKYNPSSGNWLAICGPRLGFDPVMTSEHIIRCAKLNMLVININIKSVSFNEKFARLYTGYFQYYARKIQELSSYEKSTTLSALNYGDNTEDKSLNTIKTFISNIVENDKNLTALESNVENVRKLFSAVSMAETDPEAGKPINPSNSTITSVRHLFSKKSTNEQGSLSSRSLTKGVTALGIKSRNADGNLTAPPELSVIDPFQTIIVDKANDIREATVQTYLIITAFQQSYISPFAVGMNPTYDVNFAIDVPLVSSDEFNPESVGARRNEVLNGAICSVELWIKSPIDSIPDELIGSVSIPLSELISADKFERNAIHFTPVDSFVLKQPVPDSKVMDDSDEKAVQILKNLGLLVASSESIENSILGQLDISIDSTLTIEEIAPNPISPETICLGGLQSISSYTFGNNGIEMRDADCVELYIAQLTLGNNWSNGLYFVEVVMGDISCITYLVQTTYDTPYVDFRSHLYIPRYDNKIGFNPNCLQILVRRAVGTEEKCSSLARLVEDSVIMGELLVGIDKLEINQPHSNSGVYCVYKPSFSEKYGSKGLDYAVRMATTKNDTELDQIKQSFLPGVKLRMMVAMRRKSDVVLKKIIEQSDDYKLIGDTALLIVEEELKYPISPLDFHRKCCPGEFEPTKAGLLGLPLRPISNYIEYDLNGFKHLNQDKLESPPDSEDESDSVIEEELSSFESIHVPLHAKNPVPAEFYLPENPKEFKNRKLPGIWHRIISDGYKPGQLVTRLTHCVRYVPVTIIAIYKNRTALCKWSESTEINPQEFPEGCVFIPEQRLVMGVPISFLTTPHQSGVHVYDSLITKFKDNLISISTHINQYGGYLPIEVNPIFSKYEYIFWLNADTKIQMILWGTIIRNAIRERAYNKIRAYQRVVDLMNDDDISNSDCISLKAINNGRVEELYQNKGKISIVVTEANVVSKYDRESSFYVTFQWARLPEELMEIVQNETNYDLKILMRQAVNRIIEEAILSFNLDKKIKVANKLDRSLRPDNISEKTATLHSSYIPFNLSSQIGKGDITQPEVLKNKFIELVKNISFSSYYCSCSCDVFPQNISPYKQGSKDDEIINSISSELTGLLPYKAPPNGFSYKTYISDFSKLTSCCELGGFQFDTGEILSYEEVPLLILKVFEELSEPNDLFIGHIILNTSDYMKCERPFNLRYKEITPKYKYIVSASGTGGKKFSFDNVPTALSFVLSQKGEIKVEEFYRALYGETNQARRINGPWRVRVQEDNDYHGHLSMMIKFEPDNLKKLTEFQATAYDYKEHELDYHRKQFDNSLMPFIKVPYDPNTPLSTHIIRFYCKKFKQLNGSIDELICKFKGDNKLMKLLILFLNRPAEQWLFDRCIYEYMMFLEPIMNLVEQQNMSKWKYLLADSSSRGLEQWEQLYRQGLLLHKVDELSYSSWSILVNATLKNKLPVILIELWNSDEFLGEYLLPSLPSLLLNSLNGLIQLESSLYPSTDRISRYDIRKTNLCKTELGTYINIEVSWLIKSTTEGIINLNIKDIRNIKSENTDDLNNILPRVHIYEYFGENNIWRLLSITNSGTAAKSLIGIDNLGKSLGVEEVEWENIFVFNRDSLRNGHLELPISIPAMVEKVSNVLDFSEILLNPNPNIDSLVFTRNIWKLIKSGVPNYYRPYIWMQLSGATDLKKVVQKKWISLSDEMRCGHEAFFEYLVEFSERCNSCILQQLDEDIESAKIKYHICESILGIDHVQAFWSNVRRISRALIVFSFRKKYNVFNCEKFRVGFPLQYTFGILSLTVQLLMNYGGVCLNPEDVFYLVYSVCGSKHNLVNNEHKSSIPVQGSLLPYFTSYKDQTQDEYNNMPAQILDIIFLRSALELLLPSEVDIIFSAGFQLEEIFYSALTSLFSGFLPTPTIAQLYDLIFNVYFQPKHIFESKNIDNDVEIMIPMSRRIMICLSYFIITEACREMSYKPLLSSKSIRDTIIGTMATITDPLSMINGIEKADFMIFGHKEKFEVINRLYMTYITSYQEALWFTEKQNSVLENIINMTTLQFQHGSDAPSHIGMRFINGRYVPKTVISPGLSIRDLRESIYPLIKFQALYAGRNLHQLPPNVSGYIIIKIDEVREFANYDSPVAPVVCVKMDQYKVATDPATERCSKSFIWKSNNVFMFPIPTWKPTIKKNVKRHKMSNKNADEEEEHPPQTVEITIEVLDSEALDDDNKTLSSAQVSFDRWTSSGGNLQLNNDDGTLGVFNNCNKMSLLFSWYTYVPNAELETSSLLPFSFGKQQWGDYGGFHPIYTLFDLQLFRDQMYPDEKEENIKSWVNKKRQSFFDIIRGRRIINEEGGHLDSAPTVKSMYPGKIEINTGRYGPTRSQLQQLFFFSAPSLIPYINEIVESFAKVPEYFPEEKLALTVVPLREFICSLILCSRGTLSEKSELLFDLFGYDDSNRASSAFQCMYYAHVPQYPSAIQVGSQLVPHLPPEISDKLGAPTANVISLAGIAAIVQTACIRSNIPLDNVGIYQVTASVFDHYFDVPSIMKALIIPPLGFDGRTSKEYAIHDVSKLEYSYDVKNNTKLLGSCVSCSTHVNYSLDVTRLLINHIRKNAAVEGLFGIDFSIHNCFRHFDINDPFPGLEKTLRIIISGKRSKQELRVVDLKVDSKGHFIDATVQFNTDNNSLKNTNSNEGSRIREAFDAGLSTVDFPRLSFDGSLQPKEKISSASFVFNLHNILVDKYTFVTRFCDFSLVSEAIRRITANDRTCEPNQYLKVNVEVNISFDQPKSLPHYSIDEILGIPIKLNNINSSTLDTRTDTLVNATNNTIDDINCSTERFSSKFEHLVSVHAENPLFDNSEVSNNQVINRIDSSKLVQVQSTSIDLKETLDNNIQPLDSVNEALDTSLNLDDLSIAQASARQQLMSSSSRRMNSQTSVLSAITKGPSTANLCRAFTTENMGTYYSSEPSSDYKVDIPFRPPGQVEERHNIRVYLADTIRVLKTKIMDAARLIAQKLNEVGLDSTLYNEIKISPYDKIELVVNDFDGHTRYILLQDDSESIDKYIRLNQDLLEDFIISNGDSIINMRITPGKSQIQKLKTNVHEMEHGGGALITSMYLANEMANNEILEKGLLIRNILGIPTYYDNTKYTVYDKYIEIEPGRVVSLDNLCYIRKSSAILSMITNEINMDDDGSEWILAVAIRGINTFIDEIEGKFQEEERTRISRIPQAVMNVSSVVGGFMPVTLGAFNPIAIAFDYGGLTGPRQSGIGKRNTNTYKSNLSGTKKLSVKKQDNSYLDYTRLKQNQLITSTHGWDMSFEVVLLDFHDLMVEGRIQTRESFCVLDTDIIFCFREPSVLKQFEISCLTSDEKIKITTLYETGMCPQRIALELSEDRVAALKSGAYNVFYNYQPNAVYVPNELILKFLTRYRAALEEDKQIINN